VRHWQRPALQSIEPQQSPLVRQALPAPVQQRRPPKSTLHRRPKQHWLSLVQAVMSPGRRHVVVGGRQRPALQLRPGQQSEPVHVSSRPRHTQYRPGAVPEVAQVIAPQHEPPPVPASAPAAAHCEPAGVQQRRVGEPAQSRPVQHSDAIVQPVVPAARQVTAARHRPSSQVAPLQHSPSYVHAAPTAWQVQRRAVSSQSM
jgi:hypothetical protein